MYISSTTPEQLLEGNTMTLHRVDDHTPLLYVSIFQGVHHRTVKQMHFIRWPDFGCPENSNALLAFARDVRIHMPRGGKRQGHQGPILVNCRLEHVHLRYRLAWSNNHRVWRVSSACIRRMFATAQVLSCLLSGTSRYLLTRACAHSWAYASMRSCTCVGMCLQ